MREMILALSVAVGSATGMHWFDRSDWLFSQAFSYSENCGDIVNGDWQSDGYICSLSAWYVYNYRQGDV